MASLHTGVAQQARVFQGHCQVCSVAEQPSAWCAVCFVQMLTVTVASPSKHRWAQAFPALSALVKVASARSAAHSSMSAGLYLASGCQPCFPPAACKLVGSRKALRTVSHPGQPSKAWQCTNQGSPAEGCELAASWPLARLNHMGCTCSGQRSWCTCRFGRQPVDQHCSQLRRQCGSS